MGVKINCPTKQGNLYPIHYAIELNNLELVKYLVELDFDLECRTSKDIKPLIIALNIKANPDILRYLVIDCDIDISDLESI